MKHYFNNYQISLIICTKDRPESLLKTLQAIKRNALKNIELIIIDQSESELTKRLVEKQQKLISIRYYVSKKKGLSFARNLGIKKSSSEILAFTDDDCIPKPNWLDQVLISFSKYPDISGVFGKTIGFNQKNNSQKLCPCTFENQNLSPHIITMPDKHWLTIGFGNNMAFKKIIFKQLGGFKEWLGAGSIGKSAEDAEFALRVLISKKSLFYNPNMVIEHNRWLNLTEYYRQELSYMCGEIACYQYIALSGHAFAKKIVQESIKKTLVVDLKRLLQLIVNCKRKSIEESYWWMKRILSQMEGLTIAILFSIKER